MKWESFQGTVEGTVRKKLTKPVEIKSHHGARVVVAEALTGRVLHSWGPFMGSELLTSMGSTTFMGSDVHGVRVLDPFMGAESLTRVVDQSR